VVSFFNGGYPYRNSNPLYLKGISENPGTRANQLRAISRLRTVIPFIRDNLKTREGTLESPPFYSLAAPAL
jgi:hypothetical protein